MNAQPESERIFPGDMPWRPGNSSSPRRVAVETLDKTDWLIIEALQRDGRMSYTMLAREVAMSPSAVTERVRRLEDAGVIAGYGARIDPEQVGMSILAFVRLQYPTGNYKPFTDLLATMAEVVEAHHVTGEDCFILKVLASSMRHLEETTARLATLGPVTTNIVYSSPLLHRDITAELRR